MTLNETIKHLQDVASQNRQSAKELLKNFYIPESIQTEVDEVIQESIRAELDEAIQECNEYAEECEQVAEWLIQLKQLQSKTSTQMCEMCDTCAAFKIGYKCALGKVRRAIKLEGNPYGKPSIGFEDCVRILDRIDSIGSEWLIEEEVLNEVS